MTKIEKVEEIIREYENGSDISVEDAFKGIENVLDDPNFEEDSTYKLYECQLLYCADDSRFSAGIPDTIKHIVYIKSDTDLESLPEYVLKEVPELKELLETFDCEALSVTEYDGYGIEKTLISDWSLSDKFLEINEKELIKAKEQKAKKQTEIER